MTAISTTRNSAPPVAPGEGYFAMMWIFLAAAAGFAAFGAYRMFAYSETDKIVGGDAYNFTILATRGVGLITIGCTCAIIALVFAVLNQTARAEAMRTTN